MNEEVRRLRTLHELGLLDTAPQAEYDDLARLAATLCGTPSAALTLVDEHRTWPKATFGPPMPEVSREDSLCARALGAGDFFEVEDATRDAALSGLAPVSGPPHIAFYACVPLALADGARVGALSVFDTRARRLDEAARDWLRTLARQAVCLLERQLERRRHEETAQQLADIQSLSHVGTWSLELASGSVQWSAEVFRILGLDESTFVPSREAYFALVHPEDRPRLEHAIARAGEAPMDLRVRVLRPDGSRRCVHERAALREGPEPFGQRLAGTIQDVTAEHEALLALQQRQQALERAGERLRLACEMGHLGTWEFDVLRQRLHGDAEYLRILGFEPAETPTPQQVIALFEPGHQRAIALAFEQACEHGTPYDLVLKFTCRKGLTRWTRSVGKPVRGVAGPGAGSSAVVRVHGIFQDISQQVEAVEAAYQVGRQLEATLERMSDAFYLLDGHWRFLYFNAAAERLLGRSRRELLGHTLWEAFPATVGSPLEQLYRATMADGRTRRLEFHYRPQDRWHDISAFATDEGLAVYFRDNTEQHVQMQKWRLLAESMPIVVWTARQDGTLDFASSRLARYTGVPVEQVIPQGWLALVHPDDKGAVVQRWGEAVKQLKPFEIEYRLRRFDGAWRWHLISAQPVNIDGGATMAWYGSSVDIHDHKRLEQEARALATRLTATMESITDGIFSLDDGWRFTYVNGQAEVFLARRRGELLGRTVWDEFPEAVGSRFQREYELCMRTGTVVRFEEHYPPLGKRYEVSAYPSDDGGITVYFRDVTEREQAERERAARRTAEQASEAKSRFLARISHELRTPLNAILGFAQMMEMDADAPLRGAQAERLRKVHAAGRHLLAMISEILDLASIEAGSTPLALQALDLHALVRGSLGSVEPLAEAAGVRLINDVGAGAPAVLADGLRLHQVLLNLAANAVKYNVRGGWVRLSAREESGRVRIEVADCGRGLTDEQLAHLFQPFNRLGAEKTDIEGAGLGLVIAKGLAQLMQGELHAARREGGGSVFTLELPRAHPPEAAVPAVAQPAAAPQGGPAGGEAAVPAAPASVLYIEDDPVNALLVKHILALRPNCTLHEAADGAAGIAMARRLQPDLILTDMNLPDMTGYEVLAALRADEATRDLCCIALSADAMPDNVKRALAAGFADFWTKPIDVPGFLMRLDGLLGKK
ncbi:PAS domain S-box protein [Azohydromonas lata]|uniref:histidine kinase n=1 Tax=Azohydromonas lata TaxID=45677 RepID=A0ABU5IIW7_9BURK|nr:PAS domain S-box protein [Azohydromonas lata]MDZ5458088.1 PAS domain S-box protein [Azohydromonas lata]